MDDDRGDLQAFIRDLPHPIARGTPGCEATYQYQVSPWWMLQADAQYFFRPSGGIPQADNPTTRIGNEFVIGLRTNIGF
jgi:porin